ncbi:hypothetical protein DSECCO2_570940 [anaerobic digester metagenome]
MLLAKVIQIRFGGFQYIDAGGFRDQICHRGTAERLCELDLMSLIDKGILAHHVLGQVVNHAFHQVHHAIQIGIGFIGFQHGELRVMCTIHAFITEVLTDLVHPLKAAHNQAFQIELHRDAQVKIHIESIVMGDEGSGIGTAIERLENRSFHFHVATAVHESANGRNDVGTELEDLAVFWIEQEVQIAFTIAQFDIGKFIIAHSLAIHLLFFDGGQGTDVFGEELDDGTLQGIFPGLSIEQSARNLHKITGITELENGVVILAQFAL